MIAKPDYDNESHEVDAVLLLSVFLEVGLQEHAEVRPLLGACLHVHALQQATQVVEGLVILEDRVARALHPELFDANAVPHLPGEVFG